MRKNSVPETQEVVLIGAGIMSATLAVLLKKLDPTLTITVYEKLDVISGESSNAMNNAGTGHAGFCELNYTPEKEDGSIDIKKAIDVASSFDLSREFWAHLVENEIISNPEDFITPTPHMSFVWGEDDVNFLRKRWETLSTHPLFKDMKYSEDWDEIASWLPLVMKDRKKGEPVAATRMEHGTDVNYGELTRKILMNLLFHNQIDLHMAHEVKNLKKKEDGSWELKVKNLATKKKSTKKANFVFIGAGGKAITLLEKSHIKEAKGYGGFPVSGEWLICNNPEVVKQHHAKVYGKAKIGAPPMSVPHLDSRQINGKASLLFGPFAGFSTKFLKNGSYWDFVGSMRKDNIVPMMSAGIHNIPLTKYLIEQVRQTKEDKLNALRDYFPDAKAEDWDEELAGQRVQVIQKDGKGGVLKFGTEIVCCEDGSLAGLLGASPGASTAVSIMIDLLQRCFPERFEAAWKGKIQEIIPSYNKASIAPKEYSDSRQRTAAILGLTPAMQHKREEVSSYVS
ncbi:malate dehydrogenase (quinone) [Neptunitalea lumnitzerae]|uniref:Probable malate:quinone oxidoreductase n=1 Tax=Neptunitalea lumnitzerae TaxID=2965509 RepID=A0ABQ5MFN4_9FLAO|nr:malate dehydrogenase (quinone) [Neptunitalea sp. Y10]GLB48212.1 putative malate:quinone oxidoreductase [Neptunitalea sp. Y10]